MMRINYFLKIIFHFFIFCYLVFLFYYQSKSYNYSLFHSPIIFKIGLPILVKGFAYQDINGEFSGLMIDYLNNIFIKQLNINIEYYYIENNNDYYDCILDIDSFYSKKKNDHFFLNSQVIFDELLLLKITKKKNIPTTQFVSIKSDILYFSHSDIKDIIFIDSLEEVFDFLKVNLDYGLLISPMYYNEFKGIREENIEMLQNYKIEKIYQKIPPVKVVFDFRLYWLIPYFNAIVSRLSKE